MPNENHEENIQKAGVLGEIREEMFQLFIDEEKEDPHMFNIYLSILMKISDENNWDYTSYFLEKAKEAKENLDKK